MSARMCEWVKSAECTYSCSILTGCHRKKNPPAVVSPLPATAAGILPELSALMKTVSSPLDVQVGGDHYKAMKIQPVEFIHANRLSYCEGAAIKYIARHNKKNGAQDLEKAIHYLQLLLELEYNVTSTFNSKDATDGNATPSK